MYYSRTCLTQNCHANIFENGLKNKEMCCNPENIHTPHPSENSSFTPDFLPLPFHTPLRSPFKIPNDLPQGGHGYFCGNHTIQDLQYSKVVTKFLKTRYRLSQA